MYVENLYFRCIIVRNSWGLSFTLLQYILIFYIYMHNVLYDIDNIYSLQSKTLLSIEHNALISVKIFPL